MDKQTGVQDRLKALRINRGLTQEEVGKILGMTAAGYGRLESEKRSGLKPEHCITLADYYGVTCDYIIRGINTENIDICKRTCLTQQTVNSLIDLQEDLNLCKKEYDEFLDSRSKDDDEPIYFSSHEEIEAYWKKKDLQGEIEFNMRNSLYFGQITNYLVNALIQNRNFLTGLSRACLDCTSAILSDIYITSRHGFNLESKRNEYKKGVSAANYEAGQIFSKFFSDICHDADFVSSLFDLSEEDLIFALENDHLHNVDD